MSLSDAIPSLKSWTAASATAGAESVGSLTLDRWERVRVRAILAGKRIDLRALYRSERFSGTPLAIAAGERGIAVLFRYGAAVLFNLQVVEEASFLAHLRTFVGEPAERPEEEDAELLIDMAGDECVDPTGIIHLHEATIERMVLVADVLAKSVVLAEDENRLARAFDRIEPVADALQSRRFYGVTARQLLGHIGDVLRTQHRAIGRVQIAEKPDLLWERPDLERLYARLREEYELAERDRALSRKLELITQTAETALGLLSTRSSLRVEWYIVILIVVEIVLTLYEMFVVS